MMKWHVEIEIDPSRTASVSLEENTSDALPAEIKEQLGNDLEAFLKVCGYIALAIIEDNQTGGRLIEEVMDLLEGFGKQRVT